MILEISLNVLHLKKINIAIYTKVMNIVTSWDILYLDCALKMLIK